MKKILNLSGLLASLSSAMDAPREQPLQLAALSQSSSIEMATAHSSQYKTYVSDQEWGLIYSFMENIFAAPQITSNPGARAFAQRDLTYAREYFSLYKKLYGCLDKNCLSDINLKELISKLGNFTLIFEQHLILQQEQHDKKTVGEVSSISNHLFPILQKTYNTYMWAYEKLTNKPLGNVGDLNFTQREASIPKNFPRQYLPQVKNLMHVDSYAYLFYSRNEDGYIICNLTTSNKIDDNLYYKQTKHYYGGDQSKTNLLVFTVTPSNKAVIINNKGWNIIKEDNNYYITFYTGNTGEAPFKMKGGITFSDPRANEVDGAFNKKLSIIKDIDQRIIDMVRHLNQAPDPEEGDKLLASITRMQAQQKKNKENILREAEAKGYDVDNLAATLKHTGITSSGQIMDVRKTFSGVFAKNIYSIVDSLLGNKKRAFIGFPTLPLEILEIEYLFIRSLLENSSKENFETNEFSQQYIEACFPDQTLEGLVEQYEAKLLDYYVAEEKEKLEESSREPEASASYEEEWAQRARMVAQGEHNKKAPRKKNHKKRPQSQKPGAAKKETQKNLHDQAVRAAKQRLADLSNKPIKFKNYLKLVNKVTQLFNEAGVKVSGQLNASSHGCLVVGDKKISIVRPHGRHDTIHPKASHSILEELINSYLSIKS
ncbi:hypothetical protein [Candidatus Odyssella thessalonicensis]|uniref:hypothetical protein n=1 Tax=Candidatus Odyssella thessalonicensis TaxID=84647 RepID=UPI000225AF22|nr:hypothetical protein [Candidatus Odyssella thessalonicensis]